MFKTTQIVALILAVLAVSLVATWSPRPPQLIEVSINVFHEISAKIEVRSEEDAVG